MKRIREGLRKNGLGEVDVETVENVQGKEFKALFISTVRTMWTCLAIEGRNSDPSELDFGFLSDPRFLNTAVTRAQSLLAVVGDPMSLCSVGACRDLWKDYLKRCEENNGLHGCTLKTVMDFCLRSQPLDPSAHEFTPSVVANNRKQDTSKSTSSKGEENIIASGRTVSETDMNNATATSSYDAQPSSSTAMPSQDIKPASHDQPDVDSLDGNESTEVDSGGDLQGNDKSHDDNRAIDEGQNEDEDDSGINQYTTDEFFRRDDDDNYDRIITELIKACRKTKEKDEDKQKVTSNEFPALNDVDLFPKTSAPSWPVKSMNRTFSAGLRDGKIELGFHVKDSDRLVRLTGGRMTFKESGDRESSHHDIGKRQGCARIYQDSKSYCKTQSLKAMLHGAIFLATCNAVLLLRDAK